MGKFPYVEEILVIGTFHQQMVQAKTKKKSFHRIHHSCCVRGSLSQSHARQQCSYRHPKEPFW